MLGLNAAQNKHTRTPAGSCRLVVYDGTLIICRAGASADARGFAKADAAKKEERKKKDARWELEAADVPEWGQWLSEQREAAGIKSDGVYVQVLHTEGFLGLSAGGGLWLDTVCGRPGSNDSAQAQMLIKNYRY